MILVSEENKIENGDVILFDDSRNDEMHPYFVVQVTDKTNRLGVVLYAWNPELRYSDVGIEIGWGMFTRPHLTGVNLYKVTENSKWWKKAWSNFGKYSLLNGNDDA